MISKIFRAFTQIVLPIIFCLFVLGILADSDKGNQAHGFALAFIVFACHHIYKKQQIIINDLSAIRSIINPEIKADPPSDD